MKQYPVFDASGREVGKASTAAEARSALEADVRVRLMEKDKLWGWYIVEPVR
jgi:hypothetical protein